MSKSKPKESGSVGKADRSRKVPEKLKPLICQRLAEYWRPCEVVAWLDSEHSVTLSENTVTHYRDHPRWQDSFQVFRSDYLSDLQEVAGLSIRWRLERLQRRLDQLERSYSASGGSVFNSADGFREYREILAQMQKECGDRIAIHDMRGADDDDPVVIVPQDIADALGMSDDPEDYR